MTIGIIAGKLFLTILALLPVVMAKVNDRASEYLIDVYVMSILILTVLALVWIWFD